MTEKEREELIENMMTALIRARLNGFNTENTARAALAVAEPVIREQCARIADAVEPLSEPPCGSVQSTYRNGYSDGVDAAAAAIREGGKDE